MLGNKVVMGNLLDPVVTKVFQRRVRPYTCMSTHISLSQLCLHTFLFKYFFNGKYCACVVVHVVVQIVQLFAPELVLLHWKQTAEK